MMRLHWSGVRRARSLKPPFRLHVGCGPNLKTGWVNVDLSEGSDVRLDLKEPLPFPDNSATVIYSEHFFEHLSLEEGTRFLEESMRVLVPGGVIRIGVPDAERSLRQYVSGDRERWQEIRKRYHPEWCNTPMHSVNYFFRQAGEHKYAYDFETLSSVLEDCGFVNIRRQDWDPTLDLESRRDGTLYVDAAKPQIKERV
jgi:predicted SAM-dependent methyltransferase